MTLFWSLLPLYLLGNFHCLGMCGPLVIWLSEQRQRFAYLAGRALSFSLTGLLCGSLSFYIQHSWQETKAAAYFSLLVGAFLLFMGLSYFIPLSRTSRSPGFLTKQISKASFTLANQMSSGKALPSFIFGLATILLPCGQTLLVFSACALYGDPLVGLGNGFAFAVLTSPSLWLAMQARTFISKAKEYYPSLMGLSFVLVAALALLRGLADLGIIPHLSLFSKLMLY